MNRRSAAGIWHQIVYLGVGLTLGAVGLYLSLRSVNWSAVLAALRAVRPGWLIPAVLCVVGVASLKAARWHRLFAPDHHTLDWWSLLSILILAQVVSIAVPVRGGGEMLRVGLMSRRFSVSALRASGTIVVEKLVDLLALGMVALAIAPLAAQVVGQRILSAALWLLGAGALLALTLVVRFRRSLWRRLSRWRVAARFVDQLLSGFNALRSVALAFELVGWTVAVWILSFASLFWVLRASCVTIPLWGVVVLLLLLHLGYVLPTPPGLIGLVQYVCVLVLTFFGVARDQTLGTGIVLHLVLVLPLLLLAFPAWLRVTKELS